MDLIAMLHHLHLQEGTPLDDQTWGDLAMDEVFARLDLTVSVPGRQVLYHQMRTPIREEGILSERTRMQEHFRSSAASRASVQALLEPLDAKGAHWLAPLLMSPLPHAPSYAWALYLSSFLSLFLSGLLVLSSLLALSFPPVLLFSLLGLLVANLVINETYGRRITPYLPGFGQLKRLLRVCGDLEQIAELPNREKFQRAAPMVQEVRRRLRWVVLDPTELPESASLGLGWLNLLFLFEVVCFLRTLPLLRRHQAVLAELLEAVGSLDAARSVASYLEGLPCSAVPSLTDEPRIQVRGLYHPLLSMPVANDLNLQERSALITGSNMAGKTTFMRTLGINVVLAQTLHICLAQEATLPRAVVRSSIRREDRLLEGQSYYFVELQRLKEFLDASRPLQLFLIDEIFRGTNTLERLAASAAVLRRLSQKHLVLVTTHDLELQGLLEDRFEMYHFSEQVVEGRCGFDYRIHPGPATTRNAIRLLALNGYPEAITEEASALAERLSEEFQARMARA